MFAAVIQCGYHRSNREVGRTDGTQAEAAEYLFPPGIGYPGDYLGHAEDIPGQLSDHQVGIVVPGDRDYNITAFDTGMTQHILVNGNSHRKHTGKGVRKFRSSFGVAVHNRYLIAHVIQYIGKLGTGIAAADDQNIHNNPPGAASV